MAARQALKPPVRSCWRSVRTVRAKSEPPREMSRRRQPQSRTPPPLHVPRAEGQVGAVEGRHQAGQVGRVVRPVGVHLDDPPGAAPRAPPRSPPGRPARALPWPPVAHPDARLGRGQRRRPGGPCRQARSSSTTRRWAPGSATQDGRGDGGQVLRPRCRWARSTHVPAYGWGTGSGMAGSVPRAHGPTGSACRAPPGAQPPRAACRAEGRRRELAVPPPGRRRAAAWPRGGRLHDRRRHAAGRHQQQRAARGRRAGQGVGEGAPAGEVDRGRSSRRRRRPRQPRWHSGRRRPGA